MHHEGKVTLVAIFVVLFVTVVSGGRRAAIAAPMDLIVRSVNSALVENVKGASWCPDCAAKRLAERICSGT